MLETATTNRAIPTTPFGWCLASPSGTRDARAVTSWIKRRQAGADVGYRAVEPGDIDTIWADSRSGNRFAVGQPPLASLGEVDLDSIAGQHIFDQPATTGKRLSPAPAAIIALECDQLDVAAVVEGYQCVVRVSASVNSSGRHPESELFEGCNERRQIVANNDDVVYSK